MITNENANQFPNPVIENVCFADKDILEIGCGSGGFTLDYLTKAKSVCAVDPDSDALDDLRREWESESNGVLNVIASNIEDASLPKESFTIAVFSSSL